MKLKSVKVYLSRGQKEFLNLIKCDPWWNLNEMTFINYNMKQQVYIGLYRYKYTYYLNNKNVISIISISSNPRKSYNFHYNIIPLFCTVCLSISLFLYKNFFICPTSFDPLKRPRNNESTDKAINILFIDGFWPLHNWPITQPIRAYCLKLLIFILSNKFNFNKL